MNTHTHYQDAEISHYKNIPSRLNPRIVAPKPLRNPILEEKALGLHNSGPFSADLEIIDDSLNLPQSNDLLAALMLDKKPRTPLERLDVSSNSSHNYILVQYIMQFYQEDFPSAPTTLYTQLRGTPAPSAHEEEIFAAGLSMNRPLSADPSLSTLRVGNSTPYNGHPSPKHLDEVNLDKAMGNLYINNQVLRLFLALGF